MKAVPPWDDSDARTASTLTAIGGISIHRLPGLQSMLSPPTHRHGAPPNRPRRNPRSERSEGTLAVPWMRLQFETRDSELTACRKVAASWGRGRAAAAFSLRAVAVPFLRGANPTHTHTPSASKDGSRNLNHADARPPRDYDGRDALRGKRPPPTAAAERQHTRRANL